MFPPHSSSAALFFLPAPPLRRRRSLSSPSSSSSAFSSQQFTQSDTEAEEERKFRQRRVHHQQHHHREALTPTALMLGMGRQNKKQRPKELLASCSTPKSSQEELFRPEDDYSMYFLPRGEIGGVRRHRWKKCQRQKQQLRLVDCYSSSRRRNPLLVEEKTMKKDHGGSEKHQWILEEGSHQSRKTPKACQKVPRRRLSKRMEEDEEKCSSPILLNFRRSPEGEGIAGGNDDRGIKNVPTVAKAVQSSSSLQAIIACSSSGGRKSPPSLLFPSSSSPFGRHYALLRRAKMKKADKRKHNNNNKLMQLMSSPEATAEQDDQQRYTNLPSGQIGRLMNSNSDSGMEERLEDDDDDRTQFVNISAVEKLYENLPPLAPKPQPPTAKIPLHPPPGILWPHQQLVEDFPALYARLVTLALWDARNGVAGGNHIQQAQRQMAELVGLRLARGIELAAEGDSQECFRRKCAEFSSQLAQRLRHTEAHSHKEFGWQTKKLQKILHQLRATTAATMEPPPQGSGGGQGTLQKLLRKIFRK